MVAWKWGPALAAGCTIVMKPAEQTPLTCLRMARLAQKAGIPDGVINVVPGYGPTAGAAIVKHPGVDKIAFTGEGTTAKIIQREAAETMKRLTFELGGKSPNVIFADSDLDAAVEGAHFGLYFNQGQCCCAGSRLYRRGESPRRIDRPDAGEEPATAGWAIRSIRKRSKARRSTRPSSTRFCKYIEIGKQDGAKMVTGGKRIGDRGYFIEPTLFSGVTDNMRIAREEIFGPVLSVLKFKNVDEIIKPVERHELRPRGRRVDARHRQGPPLCQGRAGRHGVDQLLRRVRRGGPVRRIQAKRYRPRAGRGRVGELH